jgi:hypothetical protein
MKETKILRTYRLSASVIEKLKTLADSENRSMGNMIEILVLKAYENK